MLTEYAPEPWERQVDEGWKEFEYFLTYRDAVPSQRKFTIIAKKFKVSDGVISKACKKHKWKERLKYYHDLLDEERREVMGQRREQMYERHANLAIQLQEKLSQTIDHLMPEDLTAIDVAKWAEVAVKIDRLSHEVSTENVKDSKEYNVRVNNSAQVILDKNSSEVACELLERLAFGPIDPSGIRSLHEPGAMEISQAPCLIEQKVSGCSSGESKKTDS